MTEPRRVLWKRRGPIHVQAPVLVQDEDGNPLSPPPQKNPEVVKFCGCGRSRLRPFCDGSHKE
jgi:CDGSH-type Zn-finger protein